MKEVLKSPAGLWATLVLPAQADLILMEMKEERAFLSIIHVFSELRKAQGPSGTSTAPWPRSCALSCSLLPSTWGAPRCQIQSSLPWDVQYIILWCFPIAHPVPWCFWSGRVTLVTNCGWLKNKRGRCGCKTEWAASTHAEKEKWHISSAQSYLLSVRLLWFEMNSFFLCNKSSTNNSNKNTNSERLAGEGWITAPCPGSTSQLLSFQVSNRKSCQLCFPAEGIGCGGYQHWSHQHRPCMRSLLEQGCAISWTYQKRMGRQKMKYWVSQGRAYSHLLTAWPQPSPLQSHPDWEVLPEQLQPLSSCLSLHSIHPLQRRGGRTTPH